VESRAVDLVSEKDFSEMTRGVKDAPKVETPKPLVEKKAEESPKPVEDSKAKITEKKEVQAAKEITPQPEPPPPKSDPIADKIKQQDEPKQTMLEQPLPPKRPPQKQQPKFDADKIAALLDKRDPQCNAATGMETNASPSLGTSSGMAAKLSQSEIDALPARLSGVGEPPGRGEASKGADRQCHRHATPGWSTGSPAVCAYERPHRRRNGLSRQRGTRGADRPAFRYAQAGAL